MTAGKWLLFGVALAASVAAAFGTLPFGWAHDVATAIEAASAAWTTAAGILVARNG